MGRSDHRSRSRSSSSRRRHHHHHGRRKSRSRSRSQNKKMQTQSGRVSKFTDAPTGPGASLFGIGDAGGSGMASSMAALNKNILAQAGINRGMSLEEQKMMQARISMGIPLEPVQNVGPNQKIQRKIYIPTQSNFNYAGLLIGPKGQNQKRLEELTGCRILVQGKGSQREGSHPMNNASEEQQHVLIEGDNQLALSRACAEVERIIFADEETRIQMRQEQLREVAKLKNESLQGPDGSMGNSNDFISYLTTPSGPPSEDAFIIPVPKDCVGQVIGRAGDNLRQMQEKSGATKVQVAFENTPGTDMRNIFIEGSIQSVEIVKTLLEEIVENQRRMKEVQNKGNRDEYCVPNSVIGLVIGKNGETIKRINAKTGAFVMISKEPQHERKDRRWLLISGSPDQVIRAKMEIYQIVDTGLKALQLKNVYDEAHAQPQNFAADMANRIPGQNLPGDIGQQQGMVQMQGTFAVPQGQGPADLGFATAQQQMLPPQPMGSDQMIMGSTYLSYAQDVEPPEITLEGEFGPNYDPSILLGSGKGRRRRGGKGSANQSEQTSG